MARRVPGCFLWLGQSQPGVDAFAAHHPRYNFNDQALPLGASFWAELVAQVWPLPTPVAAPHAEAALT